MTGAADPADLVSDYLKAFGPSAPKDVIAAVQGEVEVSKSALLTTLSQMEEFDLIFKSQDADGKIVLNLR